MRRRPSALPTLPALALALVLGVALALLSASPALAVGYRYWSFWDGADGRWSYATQGPSSARPADGTVQGFRFVVSRDATDTADAVDAVDAAARPRAGADFGAVCGATAPEPGRKRVALVVDFGLPADAPAGETPPQEAPRTACALVAPDATAAEALAAVAQPLRYNSAAMLCAVSGYPERGCGEQVADGPAARPSATAAPTAAGESGGSSGNSGGPSVGLLTGIAAVALLAAAGVRQSRRRRTR